MERKAQTKSSTKRWSVFTYVDAKSEKEALRLLREKLLEPSQSEWRHNIEATMNSYAPTNMPIFRALGFVHADGEVRICDVPPRGTVLREEWSFCGSDKILIYLAIPKGQAVDPNFHHALSKTPHESDYCNWGIEAKKLPYGSFVWESAGQVLRGGRWQWVPARWVPVPEFAKWYPAAFWATLL